MKKKTSIVYMGTPDFSVPALKKLSENPNYQIVLVVTQPDRPKGRGKTVAQSPVKQTALELGLDIYQPEKVSTPEGVEKLSALSPDFLVVAAYGQILSQAVLDIPKIYPINIHASLLPKYRGASPIQAAIANMDKKSGVTTMLMAKAMDAGDILLTRDTPISREDTAQDLHDRLSIIGAELIIETIDRILDKNLTPTPQNHDKATYVKLLKKQDGQIDWNLPSDKICAHINAMTPWPGAFTQLNGKHTKIFKATSSKTAADFKPGTIFNCDVQGIHVACGKGVLVITELMGSSGKRLKSEDYLRGHAIQPPAEFGL